MEIDMNTLMDYAATEEGKTDMIAALVYTRGSAGILNAIADVTSKWHLPDDDCKAAQCTRFAAERMRAIASEIVAKIYE